MAAKKSKSRRKSSVKFWLLTLTQNQVLRLAMLKTNLRKNNNNDHDDDDRNNNKPQQKTIHRLQQVVEDYQPGDRLKEGTPIFILVSVHQKVWKKMRLYTSTKTALHCLC